MHRWTMGMLAAMAALAVAAPAQAASGTWERAWGQNVDSVAPGTGFEICTVITQCQATNPATADAGGDMNQPSGVALDGAGNVYVANSGFNRVEKFDSSGNFIRAWGRDVSETSAFTGFESCVAGVDTCQAGTTGTGNGMMSSPEGIAVGPNGEVYVSDAGNSRIQEFTVNGNFIRMWGKDVVTSGGENTGTGFEICQLSVCKAGAASTGLIGEMNVPLALATDAVGDVYVADSSNNRIQKFDPEGVPMRTWGKDVVSAGPDNATTSFEICKAGIDTCKAGTTGGLEGEMNLPLGVAVDGSGAVYVTDANNNRVQKFSSAGGFQLAWGKDVINGGGTGFEICHEEVEVCKAGNGTGALGGELNLPAAVTTDDAGNLYVGEEDNSRVQKYGSDGTFQRLWGEDVDSAAGTAFEICTVAANCQGAAFLAPFRGGEFGIPQALATDATGHLYVADSFNNRVERFGDPVPTTTAPPPPVSAPTTTAPKKKCKKKKQKRSASAAAKKCKKKKH
jgi:tripartite motif-containing protein 71